MAGEGKLPAPKDDETDTGHGGKDCPGLEGMGVLLQDKDGQDGDEDRNQRDHKAGFGRGGQINAGGFKNKVEDRLKQGQEDHFPEGPVAKVNFNQAQGPQERHDEGGRQKTKGQ